MDLTFCQTGLLNPASPFSRGCEHHDPAATARLRHDRRKPDIGVVVFLTHKKEQAEAILDMEGVWRCPELPVLDRVLNALHAPRRDAGDDVPFGLAELLRVASWFKGVAKVSQPVL
jgi:hypothetical protein